MPESSCLYKKGLNTRGMRMMSQMADLTAASCRSPDSSYGHDDFGYDEENDADFEDSRDYEDKDSDDDSEEKSETEGIIEQFSGIKEQMYQDKLSQLKKQLQQLHDGTHPEYNKKLKKIDAANKERIKACDLWKELELEAAERTYLADKKQAAREYEEKKGEIRENLLLELEEKKKIVEIERYSLELTGDSMEYKPVSTRKLRRRGNDPPPMTEKRRKPMTTSLQVLLDEKEIDDDLKIINKSKLLNVKKTSGQNAPFPQDTNSNEPRIDNGKLFYDKKWYHKGQAVMVECKDGSKFNAVLTMIGSDMVMVRKVPDNIRLKITLAQLGHGKYLIRRKSAA